MLYFEKWKTEDEELREKIRKEYDNLSCYRPPYYRLNKVKLNKKWKNIFSFPNEKSKTIEMFIKIMIEVGHRGFQKIEFGSKKMGVWYIISISESWHTSYDKDDLILVERFRQALLNTKIFNKYSDSFLKCYGNHDLAFTANKIEIIPNLNASCMYEYNKIKK